MAVNIATIEKRYNLNSRESSLISSVYDVSVTVSILFVTILGSRTHKPRVLGTAFFVLGAGSLVFASPHFLAGSYSVSSSISAVELCDGVPDSSTREDCSTRSDLAYALFILGNVLLGLGSAPLYTLGPAYLAQSVIPRKLPVFLGVFYAMTAVGPALGFVGGSFLLRVWVHPGSKPEGITETDPQFVGAWWISYVLSWALSWVFAGPFLAFPKILVPSLYIPPPKIPLGEYVRSLKAVVTNKTWAAITLAISGEALFVGGAALFMSKMVSSLYGLPPSRAGLLVGAMVVPGAAFGMFAGGYVVRRLDLRGKSIGRLVFWVTLFSAGVIAFFLLGCSNAPMAGVNRAYLSDPGAYVPGPKARPGIASCNANCSCSVYPFKPVCGADEIQYFSACHAGCTTRSPGSDLDALVLSECACVTSAQTTAKWGFCSTSCPYLPLFLVGLLLAMFATFFVTAPLSTFTLGVVHPEHGAFSLAAQSVVFRLLGSIPGPPLFSVVMESACLLWERRCGELGTCLLYDSWLLRIRIYGLGMACKVLVLACLFYAWKATPPPLAVKDDDSVEDVLEDVDGVDAKEEEDGIETIEM